jgi:hypothetical protein
LICLSFRTIWNSENRNWVTWSVNIFHGVMLACFLFQFSTLMILLALGVLFDNFVQRYRLSRSIAVIMYICDELFWIEPMMLILMSSPMFSGVSMRIYCLFSFKRELLYIWQDTQFLQMIVAAYLSRPSIFFYWQFRWVFLEVYLLFYRVDFWCLVS